MQKFIHIHTLDSKNVQMNKEKQKGENLQDVKLAHTNLVLVIGVPKIKSKSGSVFMNWKSRIRTSSSNLPNSVISNNPATQANYYGRPSGGWSPVHILDKIKLCLLDHFLLVQSPGCQYVCSAKSNWANHHSSLGTWSLPSILRGAHPGGWQVSNPMVTKTLSGTILHVLCSVFFSIFLCGTTDYF